MSRRIDIEITSISGSAATWRAAGAKQPKGVVEISILGEHVATGNIYRAEIEQDMEGVEILSVAAPKTASPIDPRQELLEILLPDRQGPDVQVTYAKGGRNRRDGADDRPRRDKSSSERSERKRPESKPRSPRSPSSTAARGEGRSDGRKERSPSRNDRGASRNDRVRGEKRTGFSAPPVATIHRNAFLATLAPEQLPVAEQLLRGGMPAVRSAVAEQNKNAEVQGRTPVNAEAIDRIANDLLSRSALAMWKDRATGAIGAGKELRLRDLRAVVTSARTVTLDDEGRTQLKELQTSLNARVDALRLEWTTKLEAAMQSSDVLEALRLSARTPEISTRVSSDAAAKIALMASEALTAEADPATWSAIVEAASDSPIRRLIKPTGIPEDSAAHSTAVKYAGAIPELAKLLGMKVPPPPPPTAKATRTKRPATSRRS